MNSNDIANIFNQATSSATKPMEGVLSRLKLKILIQGQCGTRQLSWLFWRHCLGMAY